MTSFHHALIVGGSGMLAGLCRALLPHCGLLSVIARNAARIRAIDPAIRPLACDYNDTEAVSAALAADEAPDLLVAWIHGRADNLRRRLAEAVFPGGRFVQVLGSAHGDPSRPDRLERMKAAAAGLPVIYQAVVLGFVMDRERVRWLTDAEISEGVFSALETEAALTVVGTVEPWSAKP